MSVKPQPSKKSIEKIINKGANVSEENQELEWTMISLRLPKSFIKKLDEQRAKYAGMNRNSWILQMIQKNIETG